MNSKTNSGDTPLHKAADNGNSKSNKSEFQAKCIKLFRFSGYYRVEKILIDRGTDINSKDIFGSTPLHIVVRNPTDESVQNLVDRGANVNLKNNEGWAPIHVAAAFGNFMSY